MADPGFLMAASGLGLSGIVSAAKLITWFLGSDPKAIAQAARWALCGPRILGQFLPRRRLVPDQSWPAGGTSDWKPVDSAASEAEMVQRSIVVLEEYLRRTTPLFRVRRTANPGEQFTNRGWPSALAALLSGALALVAIMFVAAALMLSVLFSAIIAERKRELGLLRAIGARRRQIVGMLLTEAGLATALGGLVGVILGLLLMRVYEHSLVYYLDRIGIPFVWLNGGTVALIAAFCIVLTSLTGAAGAFYPAWRASALEPYALIRSEG